MSFTQQLQRHSRQHGGRSTNGSHVSSGNGVANGVTKYGGKKHSNPLPNVQEFQSNIGELINKGEREGKW